MQVAVVLALVAAGCGADLLNNQGIHDHVDDLVAHDRTDAVPANRWLLDAGALVPFLGSYELDHRVYGSVRPSAIVVDWILGGIVPAGAAVASFVFDDALTRRRLRWGALGLYGATRIGIEIVGNLHIDEYNDYLAERLATSPRAHIAAVGWQW
jgi:hypothetical protein